MGTAPGVRNGGGVEERTAQLGCILSDARGPTRLLLIEIFLRVNSHACMASLNQKQYIKYASTFGWWHCCEL